MKRFALILGAFWAITGSVFAADFNGLWVSENHGGEYLSIHQKGGHIIVAHMYLPNGQYDLYQGVVEDGRLFNTLSGSERPIVSEISIMHNGLDRFGVEEMTIDVKECQDFNNLFCRMEDKSIVFKKGF